MFLFISFPRLKAQGCPFRLGYEEGLGNGYARYMSKWSGLRFKGTGHVITYLARFCVVKLIWSTTTTFHQLVKVGRKVK